MPSMRARATPLALAKAECVLACWVGPLRERASVKLGSRRIEHGSISYYTNHKCRCDPCRGAWSAHQKAYYKANRETIRHAQKAYLLANTEVIAARQQAYETQHVEERRLYNGNRRARKLAAFVESVLPGKVFDRDRGICGICNSWVMAGEKWHIDHVLPLARGGKHSYDNVQLAHATCNLRKGIS